MKASKPLTMSESISVLLEKVERIEKDIEQINAKLENNYVPWESFQIVQRIVYGMVGMILIGVLGALISLVVV